MRSLLLLSLLTTAASAQPITMEQRVATEIGQCVLQRAGLATENEALRARIAALEAKIKEGEGGSGR